MRISAILLICVLLASASSKAQKVLVFDRDSHATRIRFHVHDEIEVRTAGKQWESGEITDMSDSSIIVADDMIPVSKITAIRYDQSGSGIHLLRGFARVLPFAALALLSIYAINAIINNNYPIYSKSTLIAAGAIAASAPLTSLLTFHTHIINQHHRLKIIDVSIW